MDSLQNINKNINNCKKCRLYKTAKNAVPGEGNEHAEIVFIGEAPGRNEDETGRPFVGRAGQLLESILKDIGLSRKDVWIGNVIKHRPPDNRDPLPDEIDACRGYLNMQLDIIDPVLIVTLGRFAMNYFYPNGKISRDKGRLYKINGRYIYPIYHPAAALRSTKMLKAFEDDFKKIPSALEKVKKYKSGEIKIEKRDDDVESDDDGQLGLKF